MKIIGWIFVAWLIGSIIYSLAFIARGVAGMKMSGAPDHLASPWKRRMIIIQAIKTIIALGLISLMIK